MGTRSSITVPLVSAAVAAATVWLLPAKSAAPAPALPFEALDAERLQVFEARLEALEQRSAAVQVAADPGVERRPAERAEPATDAALLARLERLERRLDDLARDDGQRAAIVHALERAALAQDAERSDPQSDAAPEQSPEQSIEDARRMLADPAASAAEKVAAHFRLRRQPDAYTDAMAAELVTIGLGDPDATRRAGVWTAFDGASHLPQIVPALLRALHGDSDPGVRAEAAETLGNYVDLPGVADALRHAASHDVDRAVRQKALRTLTEEGLER